MKHTIRHKDGGEIDVDIHRTAAIKLFCTECLGWGEIHPKDCVDRLCPLYPFRGKSRLAILRSGKPPLEGSKSL